MKYKTDRELIMETYNYYGKDPVYRRSTQIDLKSGDVNCAYNSDKGHCAVGRCLKAEYRNQGNDLNGNLEGISGFENSQGHSIQTMVKPSYKRISDSLWVALQDFHDNSDYWWFGEDAPEYDGNAEIPERSGQFKYLTIEGEDKIGKLLSTAKFNKKNIEEERDYS